MSAAGSGYSKVAPLTPRFKTRLSRRGGKFPYPVYNTVNRRFFCIRSLTGRVPARLVPRPGPMILAAALL